MKENHYESVIIINAALEDTQIEDTIKKIENFISSNGGKITDIEKWGRKRLAYPIKKSKSGFYVIYRFTAPAEMIKKLERTYKLDETIYRFLTIKLTKKDLEHLNKKLAEKKAEESEKSETAPEPKAEETVVAEGQSE